MGSRTRTFIAAHSNWGTRGRPNHRACRAEPRSHAKPTCRTMAARLVDGGREPSFGHRLRFDRPMGQRFRQARARSLDVTGSHVKSEDATDKCRIRCGFVGQPGAVFLARHGDVPQPSLLFDLFGRSRAHVRIVRPAQASMLVLPEAAPAMMSSGPASDWLAVATPYSTARG
jgi:hypothetical protein